MNLPKMNLRVFVAVVAGVFVLAFLNWNIFQRERLIEHGRMALLQLAPVDPRSLMQGDYMALRFAIAGEIRRALQSGSAKEDEEQEGLPRCISCASHDGESKRDGKAVLALDENHVARFVRIDNGAPLQLNEARLRYRIQAKYGDVHIATNAFFFEEGQGKIYESARYGEFRIAENGDAILTQLRDKDFNVLGRSTVLR
ncbi:MAG: GDYXXLXY domain-containing protein [Burkholderiales bacterium]|jgi:uncharacterized membrane-anchored protein|nr:GDYXXLXY domain-containing protein [Burkholderiales bacterium]